MKEELKIRLEDNSEVVIDKFIPFGDDPQYIAIKGETYYKKNGEFYVILKDSNIS